MRLPTCFAVLALGLVAPASMAQQADVVIKPEMLGTGVAVLFGQGGNIGVSFGEDGTVLVDDQFAPLTVKIQEAVAALGAMPIKYLINTHWHFDHTGGNENLGKAGALIIAHDNVRVRMAAGQSVAGRTVPAAAKVALPVITYHDGLSLHLNGDEVRTVHVHNGHTDGDSIVMWQNANIIHTGDLFVHKATLPFIDMASGGTAKGMLAGIDKVIGLTNPATKIIPGHGPVATQADLIAHRAMLKDVIGKVEAGIKAKRTQAQIIATKPAANYEPPTGAFITGDRFVEAIYKSLIAPPSAKPHKH